MKVLAIYGSQRKNGNTAKMLDANLSEFPPGPESIISGSSRQFAYVSALLLLAIKLIFKAV